ncbi:arsenical resistance protein ArsH [Francisella sp. 19X1-34]|uniref:arsenical resistance protein ArsH n=1 Tax=Francisella sp. 19X1-34 TaxID=3087177 RepID=UPI002E37DE23|nr:arsenical resistance protein ArsH [Francisella sp. 19X1-34]MED7789490.1 arsenical resistance protein ArsH [Francisella sp. 19X1-34]
MYPNYSLEKVEKVFNKNNLKKRSPRILFLYGSLRDKSYSFLLAKQAMKIIKSFGAEVEIFHPHDLPLADISLTQNPDQSLLSDSVKQMRKLMNWADAMVWVSPEVHGAMSSVFKNIIDWMPLSLGAVRPTQGKLLALMQVTGGSQSFNTLNQMRILGRWMRMITIPNQSSVPLAYTQFNEDGSMKESNYKDRVVDLMEELFKYCILFQGNIEFLHQRYSEQKDKKNITNNNHSNWKSAKESLT